MKFFDGPVFSQVVLKWSTVDAMCNSGYKGATALIREVKYPSDPLTISSDAPVSPRIIVDSGKAGRQLGQSCYILWGFLGSVRERAEVWMFQPTERRVSCSRTGRLLSAHGMYGSTFGGLLSMLNVIKGSCPIGCFSGLTALGAFFFRNGGGYDQDRTLRRTTPSQLLPSVHGTPGNRFQSVL